MLGAWTLRAVTVLAGLLVTAPAAVPGALAGIDARPAPDAPDEARVAGSPGPQRPAPGGEAPPEPGPPPLLPDGLPGDRPNIMVLMADDMRTDELALMPNVRRWIVDRGVQLTNAFSPYPLCCPARASFLTGQYTHNHGVWSNRPPYGFLAFDDSSTLATDLSAAGYRTAMLGKYLNGYGHHPPPTDPAADEQRYVPPGWDDWRGMVRGAYHYRNTTLNVNGALRDSDGAYQTRFLGSQAADMVSGLARGPAPFFLWVSYVAPHVGRPTEDDDPVGILRADGRIATVSTPARPRDVVGIFRGREDELPHPRIERDRADKPGFLAGRPRITTEERQALRQLVEQRAEALAVLDAEVGRTMAALRDSGELERTLVVFLSDNGFVLGEHGVLVGKLLSYEPSLRVPILMAGPGIPAGEVRTDPAMILDLAPTFLELAGAAPARETDGVNLLDLLRVGDRGWHRAVFTESRRRPVPEVPGGLLDRAHGPSRLRFSQGVRVRRFLYVEHATRERELYDLRRDPDQLDNVVSDAAYAATVAGLARVLDEMRTCHGRSCAAPLPDLPDPPG